MKLRELNIGDRFIAASDKTKKERFKKTSRCVFNPGHGTSTCECLNETKRKYVSKSCNLNVILLPAKQGVK